MVFVMMVLRLKSGGKKMSENIFGIITRFGEDDFSYWEGFSLSEIELSYGADVIKSMAIV